MRGIKGTLKAKIAVLRIKKGDTEAFGYLYDLYIDKIYRYIYFRISDRSIAHDLTQETFLATWEYIADDNIVKNVSSLLYRIAHNKIVDHYRNRGRQAALLDDVPESLQPLGEHNDHSIELHLIQKNIKKLKSEYQDVLLLRYIEGLSIHEIATIISKDVNNVRVLLHRALNSLKDYYHKQL